SGTVQRITRPLPCGRSTRNGSSVVNRATVEAVAPSTGAATFHQRGKRALPNPASASPRNSSSAGCEKLDGSGWAAKSLLPSEGGGGVSSPVASPSHAGSHPAPC